MLLEFARRWKTATPEERDAALTDPWRFKELVISLPAVKANVQREALLNLVHPDAFERSFSRWHKERIVNRFSGLVSEPTSDIDQRLLQIRQSLSEKYGRNFDFYDDRVRPLWLEEETGWDGLIRWAKRFYEWAGFDAAERTYKLEIVEKIRQARSSLFDGSGDWLAMLREALEAVMNLIRNGLGMRKAGDRRRAGQPENPHSITIFIQVHNTL